MQDRSTVIIGGGSEYVEFFKEIGHVLHVQEAQDVLNNLDDLQKFDLFVFTGGADVHPSMYQQIKHPNTVSCNRSRDESELDLYYQLIGLGVSVLGICRGAQLLAVANGYSLFQDVLGHTSTHAIQTKDGSTLYATSTHHQMIDLRPQDGCSDFELLAWSNVSSQVEKMPDVNSDISVPIRCTPSSDPEVVLFPDLDTLLVQGHPEFKSASPMYKQYVLKQVQELITATKSTHTGE